MTLVWLITGVSSGLGLHLTQIVLARGDKVIATARSPGPKPHDDLPTCSPNLKLIQLDLDWDTEQIHAAVKNAVQIWGRVDVLVNNAGYSHKGLAEEVGSAGFKQQFQTNFFGLMDVTNAVLPTMRQRRSGTIVNIGSRTSWRPDFPGGSIYGSSKAAVRVYSESLATEIAPFGIRMLIVEPASFKSDTYTKTPWDDRNPIADYANLATQIQEVLRLRGSAVKGDPHKGMSVVADVVRGEGVAKGKEWPLYLLLGDLAISGFKEKAEIILERTKDWEPIMADLNCDE
ncbi:NAD(P)-binding protein [Dendrothele bispora CBS 962.96]|uniref:NAD(P)-binding protein n=1 Tax=Dendrothele bispora (strain CBS 962.96) TaxID=1314807 RepID=A0A4S8M794_DENBC|nr:NAD(P)-binding protein [Dendrothele bispora CBS 962.96]